MSVNIVILKVVCRKKPEQKVLGSILFISLALPIKFLLLQIIVQGRTQLHSTHRLDFLPIAAVEHYRILVVGICKVS